MRRRGVQVSWFGLKTKVDNLSVLWPQNLCDGFPIWASKPIATIWWFGPQNHHDGFLVWSSKPCRLWFIGCPSKPMGGQRWRGTRVASSSLLCLKASRARVFQFCLKTGRGATMDGACGIIMKVTWKWSKRWSVRWRQVQHSGSRTKLPLIRYNFPFSQLGHSGLLFSL
jgi:hypothetical protein